MRTPSPRFPWPLAAVLLLALAGLAFSQGWNNGPTIVKKCPRCGYQTENLSETTCPNCSGLGRGRSSSPPPTNYNSGGNTASPFGAPSSSSGSATPKESGGLTVGENVRIAIGIMVGSLLVICLIIGGAHLVLYLKNNVGKKPAQPARRSRRSRYDDDEDDDD